MVATLQSSNLSSLSPRITVYTSSLSLVGSAGSSSFGDTVSVTANNVQAGQGYYIRVMANVGGTQIGDFGLEVNLGSQTQAPIPPPNTVVAQQPDQGGGTILKSTGLGSLDLVRVGNFIDWGDELTVANPGRGALQLQQFPAMPGLIVSADATSIAAALLQNLAEPHDQLPAAASFSGPAPGSAGVLPVVDPSALALDVFQAVDSVLSSWSSKSLLSAYDS
jgi:hypothetical protein